MKQLCIFSQILGCTLADYPVQEEDALKEINAIALARRTIEMVK